MMQNLFGDQSEDEEEADDDDVVEVVVDDDDQLQESPPQQQRHQELDDDEEGDARSHAHARSDGYHSIGACFLPTNPTHASPLSTHASRPPSTGAERDLQGIHLFTGAEIHPGFGRPLLLLDLRSQLQELIPEQQCDNKDYFPSDPTEMQGWRS